MTEPEFFSRCETIVIHIPGETTAREIEAAQLVRLFDVCTAFIARMQITCPEVIHQSDRVIVGAYKFIEEVCNEAGYFEREEEDG